MPKKKNQPEPYCIFNDPNSPEDWTKLLVEMCVEKLLKKFDNEPLDNT